MPTQLGLFAKHWTPGLSKTRLAANIGDKAAAEAAKAFVETLVQRLSSVADTRVVVFTPESAADEFADLAGGEWSVSPQAEGDLGIRMAAFFAAAFAAGANRVVIVGADSPDVPLESIRDAFDRLKDSRLVLGPSDDGGYYLIGARDEPPPVLDGMPWSSPRLWEATLDRLNTIGWKTGVDWVPLPGWYDVDTMEELKRLRSNLAAGPPDPALARLAARLDALLPESG